MINKMPIKFFEARIIQNSKELQELEDEFNASETADINTLFPLNTNTNNNTSAVVVNNNNNNNSNDDGSWWCTRGYNVYHKNEFGHHCREFITGAEGEDKPGYFGGTPDEERKF